MLVSVVSTKYVKRYNFPARQVGDAHRLLKNLLFRTDRLGTIRVSA